jgi:hypothetical protein
MRYWSYNTSRKMRYILLLLSTTDDHTYFQTDSVRFLLSYLLHYPIRPAYHLRVTKFVRTKILFFNYGNLNDKLY